jgi:hypothetical protein
VKNEDYYIRIIQNWVEKFVIQLDLCPFAAKPFLNDRIRFAVCKEVDHEKILMSFYDEVQFLLSKNPDEISTTLLIVPGKDKSFSDYLELYDSCDFLLEETALHNVIQLASFHPLYQFDGTLEEDVTNYTNRAPFSVVHLLRAHEVEDALDTFSNPEEIHMNNVQKMQTMGKTKLEQVIFDIMKS